MKIMYKGKDGGSDSNVTGYWLVEIKALFSIVLLCFDKGSREAFHNHAFHAISWVIKGHLKEHIKTTNDYTWTDLVPSFKPIFTPRDRMHQVFGMVNKTWVISFRGPWLNTWKEYFKSIDKTITLTNGRVIVK